MQKFWWKIEDYRKMTVDQELTVIQVMAVEFLLGSSEAAIFSLAWLGLRARSKHRFQIHHRFTNSIREQVFDGSRPIPRL